MAKKSSKMKVIIASLLAATVVAGGVIGGSLAYLQDEDSDVNVMTLGNVDIVQNEYEWETVENTSSGSTGTTNKLVPFTQGKPLYPYVGELGWTNTEDSGGAYRQFTMNNVVDKYVTVTNTGKSDAYVRTFIALEMGDYSYEEFNMIGLSTNSITGAEFPGLHWKWTDDFVAEIDGKNYNIMVAVYDEALKPEVETIPSLLQVYLKNTATNETVEKLDGNNNGTYDILTFTEAVQVNGFDDPVIALNTAFGDTSAPTHYHPWAEDGVVIPTAVATADELTNALAAGESVYLTENINMGSETLTIKKGAEVDLKLNGYDLSGTCDGGQAHLIMVPNTSTLNVYGGDDDKITYAQGSSNVGWTIDLEGTLNLYSGTIELTGDSWSIGYAVDVRPNAWGSNYAESATFHMYGGKIVSSDGAVRVASSSSDTYPNIVAEFIMDGGVIDATWDGVFVQQSNAAYDTLNVEIGEDATITSGLAPIRVYGPNATGVNSGAAKPMTITVADLNKLTFDGTADPAKTWYKDAKIMYGGGMTLDNLNQYTTFNLK